jgi:DNA repair protein RadA/Sms
MPKKKNIFICISCGSEQSKWLGRCPVCGEWNSIVEADTAAPARAHEKKRENRIIPLAHIQSAELTRIKTDMEEFNLVCGGGIVPGSVILISGEPGIGKSTLALQIACGLKIASDYKTLYVSGEESPVQLRHRAERLGIKTEQILVSANPCAEDIAEAARADKYDCIIVDSVQTLYTHDIPSSAGSVAQIRESSARLIELAKTTGIPIILIGHITKEGSIAGPKLLEHLVDTVLYFEGDFTREFRMIKAFKNRFGSVNEIGLFQMTGKGLIEVKDKNSLFFSSFSSNSPGSAVSAAIEGTRTILFEVQALVTFTGFSYPRRMSDGFDINRLILLVAVLEKHGFMKLNTHDVFINLAGGFKISETSADLAVAIAVASSLKDKAIPKDTGFLGEISLSGEIRPVSQCIRRVQEFGKSGFARIVVPEKDVVESQKIFNREIIGVKNIYEAIDRIF